MLQLVTRGALLGACVLAAAAAWAQDYRLTLGEQTFDPLVQQPVVPSNLAAPRAAGANLHLIQYTGATRDAWLETLKANGIEVVQYVHPYTYIVWCETRQLDSLARAEGVRWSGDFLPAYRLLPRLRNARADEAPYRILVPRLADARSVAQQIADLGGKVDDAVNIDATFAILPVDISGAMLETIANIPGVYSIQDVPTDGGDRGEMSNQVNVNNVDATNLAFPGYQTWLSSVGLDGAGVIIANVDGGVQDSHPGLAGRLLPCTGATCGGSAQSSHGTHTAGIMAADGTGSPLSLGFLRGLGVAPGAHLVEQVYSPTYTQAGGMLKLMTDSYNNGASLSGNSWGPSGTPKGYDGDTRQVDVGVRDADPNVAGNQPLTFVLSFMNGNGGTSSQGTPDEGKNLFNIGSTKMQNSGSGTQILQINDVSSNSAHGPALDGRTIPHLVAPGCYVDSTYTTSTYSLLCGTSMASPHVSGAVALFIEYYRSLPDYVADPSPALVKAAFLPAAHDLAGNKDADGGTLGHPFDSKQGWGRMDLEAVVDPQVSVRYFDNPTTLGATGEQWTQVVSAADPTKPIKMMLVWTDAPGHGLGGSTPAWNNDLNLVVEDGATTYRGNQFGANGYSINSATSDTKNNTEGVFIGPTAPSSYTIKVVAANINSDGVPNNADTTDQDFALACYNCAEEPTFTLAADPAAASVCAPANVPVTVTVGQILGYSDPVTLSVTNLPAGVTADFDPNPVVPAGVSTLSIAVGAGAAPGSYNLNIEGVSGSITRNTSVTLNVSTGIPAAPALIAPANGATGVALQPVFDWADAAQASTYDIQVAKDAAFTNVVASATGLTESTWQPGSPLGLFTGYFWRARAANICGTGPWSTAAAFTTRDVPAVLLVDDDDNGPDVRSYYTAALGAIGQDYDLWDTGNSDANEPPLATLMQYSYVVWFTGDEFGGAAGPSSASETALAAFLDSGRNVFISAQDYRYDKGFTPFMDTYLGTSSITNDTKHTTVTGAGFLTGFGPYSLTYPFSNYSDTFAVDADASVIFNGSAGIAASAKSTTAYRTAYLGFPLEAISDPLQRAAVLQAILNWFRPYADCNDNGIADHIDIANGTMHDVNGNGTPDECEGPTLCAGDMNCDGQVDFEDINPFVEALGYAGGAGWPHACPWLNGDTDNDGNVTFKDINPFVSLLGQSCN